MSDLWRLAADLAMLVALLLGMRWFRRPDTARGGTFLAAAAMLFAVALEIARHPPHAPAVAVLALVLGSGAGWMVARRMDMTGIPSMVAVQNGAGGLASMLVAFEELADAAPGGSAAGLTAAVFALAVGAVTFSGSAIAGAKLSGLWKQTPGALRGHSLVCAAVLAASAALAAAAMTASGGPLRVALVGGVALAATLLGLLCSLRVGGADMPVLISFLNAFSGLAGALCGIALRNHILIACGAMVAASGLILTYAMCRAMNRDLLKVFLGTGVSETAAAGSADSIATPPPPVEAAGPEVLSPLCRAVEAVSGAKRVIIVPGYGMALAHAQFEVARLATRLKEMGKEVKFAVHPIAGRMPGHMHVLLAEAEVDPDLLFDMAEINPDFAATDLAIVVGACDVVNPAANEVEGSPISGMPILAVHDARCVLVCNLDGRPGYSGVENSLYRSPKSILLFGDAKANLGQLLEAMERAGEPGATPDRVP